jgi:TRAP transporter TAXI family solute receptor
MAGAGVLATGLTGIGVTGCWGPTLPITIAGGPPGGVYQKYAEMLADAVNAAERHLNCKPEVTQGSVENIRLIGKGDAHFGIAQADAALAALAGLDPFQSAAVPLSAIGRVYQDYLQIVVRKDAALHAVADLDGKKVWTGLPESGIALFSRRLIEVTELRVDRQDQPIKEATTALENRHIDAMLVLGGVPVPALAELHGRVGIRLLPTEELLPDLRSRYGTVYRKATIPPGSYGKAGMVTVGVANLLMCANTLADDIAATVTQVLIDRATQLVPPRASGTQFGDSRSLINTLGVPMHPGAASVYRHQHG